MSCRKPGERGCKGKGGWRMKPPFPLQEEAKWANEGKIRAQDAYTTYEDQKAIARYYGYDLLRIDKYEEFEKFINNGNGVLYGQLRIGTDPKNYNKGHNIDLYRYNGGWYGSDVGSWKNHGVKWYNVIKDKKDFRYFQYLIKR